MSKIVCPYCPEHREFFNHRFLAHILHYHKADFLTERGQESYLRNCWTRKRRSFIASLNTHGRGEEMIMPMCFGCGMVWKKDIWCQKHDEDNRDCYNAHLAQAQALHAECIALTGAVPATQSAAEAAAAGSGSVELIEKQAKELTKLRAQVERFTKHRTSNLDAETKFFEMVRSSLPQLEELWNEVNHIVAGCVIRGEYDEDEQDRLLGEINLREYLPRAGGAADDYTAQEMAEERRRREEESE